MKAGWTKAELGDVCKIYQPKTISAKEMTPDGPYPVFGANGVIGRYSDYNHEAPQLLVTCRGATCGAVNISEPYSWITGNAMVVRPKIPDLSLRFTEYFFRGVVDLDGVITGAAQPQITRTSLSPIRIAYPPLEEQQRIVAILDEAFEGLARAHANAEANLQNAWELVEAGLGTSFSSEVAQRNEWELHGLKTLADITYGYTTKAHSDPTGPRFLRITDIQDGIVDWDKVPYCDAPPDDYERYRVKSGDIVFARTGATTGKSYLLTEDIEAVAASYLIRLRVKSSVLKPEYLALFFQSDVYWESIRAGISGSAQGGFNASKLGALIVPVPPISVQDKVISRLQEIQIEAFNLATSYRMKLQDLDDLRQSLLQRAFAGELT